VTRFLVDSSALLALMNRADQHYSPATLFVRSHVGDGFHVPDTVFTETMTLIKARLGVGPAVDLGSRIRASVVFALVPLTPEDYEATWGIFSRYTDKEWSYVDCSMLAIARRLGIPNMIAFDHHFDQMVELTRVPIPAR